MGSELISSQGMLLSEDQVEGPGARKFHQWPQPDFFLVVGKKKKTLLDSSMVKPGNVLQERETAAASKSMLIFRFGRETADSVLVIPTISLT